MSDESAAGKSFDWKLFKRLLPYAKPYWKGFAIGVICMLSGTTLELAGPLLTKRAIDVAIPNRDFHLLLMLVFGYIAATSVGYGLRYIETLVSGYYGNRIVWDLRRKVFSRFQYQSLAFFDRNPVGRLMTLVTSDVAAMAELFGASLVGLVGDVLSLLGILGVLFYLNWKLALVTMIVAPLLTAVTLALREKMRLSFRKMRGEITRTNTYLQESITGIKVVKLFLRERRNAEQFAEISEGLKAAQLQTIFYFALFFPIVDLIATTAVAATLLTGGWQILNGAITVGALVAFLQYGERFFRPIRDLSEKYNVLQSAFAGAERVFGILDEPLAIEPPKNPVLLGRVRGEIEFRNVDFYYVDNVPVLQDISFKIAPGETVALVGATGAGKSTVLQLLGRHYDIQGGEITVDGIPLTKIDPRELRGQMAVVLQDVFLFAGTVADNLAMSDVSIPRQRIEWAAKEVGAHEFIMELPQGYNTPLLERGVNLSVGQKQLLSLARALVTDPAILLLDEATSSVDSETEHLLQHGLNRIMEGRTAIVVAHRLSTIQHADRIMVFHKGKLREQGTHTELVRMNGIYSRLYRLQFDMAA
jgi:ATP-binding cassette, subfamily B, multidrug efflux pump